MLTYLTDQSRKQISGQAAQRKGSAVAGAFRALIKEHDNSGKLDAEVTIRRIRSVVDDAVDQIETKKVAGLHITFVCSEPGCQVVESAAFERLDETYGDLINAFTSAGWQINPSSTPSTDLQCWCPSHSREVL